MKQVLTWSWWTCVKSMTVYFWAHAYYSLNIAIFLHMTYISLVSLVSCLAVAGCLPLPLRPGFKPKWFKWSLYFTMCLRRIKGYATVFISQSVLPNGVDGNCLTFPWHYISELSAESRSLTECRVGEGVPEIDFLKVQIHYFCNCIHWFI